MKIRKGIIGTTILFAGGCLQATPGTLPDVAVDTTVSGDTTVAVDTTVSGDTIVSGDTTVAGDTTQTDGTACYEVPEDPKALIGQACAWPDALECTVGGWTEWIQCVDGAWAAFQHPDGTDCVCDAEIVDCAPAGVATCEFAGVGFVGIHRAGWDRKATRRLRMV